MLKTLAILGLFMATAQNLVPLDRSQEQQHPQSHQDVPKPNQIDVGNVGGGNVNGDGTKKYAQYKAEAEQYLKDAFAPAYFSNWVLAGLGVIGGIFAYRSLLVFKKQTNAAINAERSRIFIQHKTLKDDTLLSFDFFAVNRGRSPAAITYYFVEAKVLPCDEPLPPKPIYGETGKYGLSGNQWVLPEADKPFHFDVPEETILTGDSDPEQWKTITQGKAKVWVYGLVRYRDGISPTEHETGFCYFWAGFKLLLEAGPEAYRRCT